jgi:hypothetical protein
MNWEGFYGAKEHNEKKTRYHARQRTVGDDAGDTGSIGQKHSQPVYDAGPAGLQGQHQCLDKPRQWPARARQ